MWIDSVQSTIIDVAQRVSMTGALRTGHAVSAVVEGSEGNLSVVVAGVRIPIPDASQLQPGQAVTAELVESPTGPQLRLSPAQQTPADQTEASELVQFVAGALKSLGSTQSAELASQLIPVGIPFTEESVQSLLTLFTEPGSVGDDLQMLAALVEQAGAAGGVSAETARQTANLIGRILARQDADWSTALPRWADAAGRSIEARLAQLLAASGDVDVHGALKGDLRTLISQLRNNDALAAYLNVQGKFRAFQDATARILNRLDAAQLQNLHGLDVPYLFVEIPLPQGGPIREGRLHFFGESGASKSGAGVRNASVVLDLSTENLGDLWVTLQWIEGRCNCHFAATSPEIVGTIERAQGDLARQLEGVGYQRATIQVSLWDGDRLRATAQLMRRCTGIDVKA